MLIRMISSFLLLATVVGTGVGLASWKQESVAATDAAAASQPEPMEVVTSAVAQDREHRRTTTVIGTVTALRSVTLRNELAGTVERIRLTPGQVVDAGTLLVALDVSVEEAELKAQEAELALAETSLGRMERASAHRAVSEIEVDRARAERDVARARSARTRAIIARKTIRAPFRARIGLSDVHPGQYLHEGTPITTLQGVDDAAHVDFHVAQHVADSLREGDAVEVLVGRGTASIAGVVVAVDARVDASTRHALVRARVDARAAPAPGASVRVRVPIGPARTAVAVPVSALRRGPAGDHVFVIAADETGAVRAHVRRVRVGPVLASEVLVHEGLVAGEQVAASGSFKLREHVLVAVVDGAVGPGAR